MAGKKDGQESRLVFLIYNLIFLVTFTARRSHSNAANAGKDFVKAGHSPYTRYFTWRSPRTNVPSVREASTKGATWRLIFSRTRTCPKIWESRDRWHRTRRSPPRRPGRWRIGWADWSRFKGPVPPLS